MSRQPIPPTEFSNSRLVRVVPSIASCAIGWLAFGIYYLLTGRMISGSHCILQGCLGIACVLVAWFDPPARLNVARCYVLKLIVGLTIDACLGGIASALAPMFYCCAVLLATLTLGGRFARRTIALCLALIPTIYFVLPHLIPATPGPSPLDLMLGYIALLCVIASCALVGESTAEAFACRLQEATDSLRARTETLDRIAGIDALTSIPNRRKFRQDTVESMQTCHQDDGFALLLIDLNDFKLINDRYGHAEGDSILRQFSLQLKNGLNGAADIYRIGGDEFVAVVRGQRNDLNQKAQRVGETVLSIMNSITQHRSRLTSQLSGSIGAALYPEHADSLDALMSFADKAMYEAKASKRLGDRSSIVIFESRMAAEMDRKRQLDESLNEAIANEEFVLFYQPQVNVTTGRIVGVEALIRWRRGDEFVSPFHFVPALEESGKIIEVGYWVLRDACEQMAKWRSLGFDIHVSVNVSSLQLQQPGFADSVIEILSDCNLSASALDLEFTESLLLETGDHVHKNIERLANENVRFSIDDFGTGYSSLSYLKRLIVHRLKIDRSFIKDVPNDDDGAIAATVIALANQLGLAVVGEGVETDDQLQFLRDRGCNEFQGYLFSRPIPSEECSALLGNQFNASEPAIQPCVFAEGLTWAPGASSKTIV